MKKRILIIEDSDTEAHIVQDFLVKKGFVVNIAPTGEDGMEKAKKMKPDLILLDLILPGIDGFEVCKLLKKEPALSKTIIIIVSIKHDLEDINKALYSGADDYILKPLIPQLLEKKIGFYLGYDNG